MTHNAFAAGLRGPGYSPSMRSEISAATQRESLSISAGIGKEALKGKAPARRASITTVTEETSTGAGGSNPSGESGTPTRNPFSRAPRTPSSSPFRGRSPEHPGGGPPGGPPEGGGGGGGGGGRRSPSRGRAGHPGRMTDGDIKRPKPATPTPFTGDRDKWVTLVIQASVYFAHYQEFFEGEGAKSLYLLGWFEGKTVRPWADEILSTMGGPEQSPLLTNFQLLLETAAALWGPLNQKQNAQNELDKIHQETTVSAYHAKFAPLASRSKYDREILVRTFYKGLKEPIKNLMMNIKRPETVERLLEAALEFESRILERIEERKTLEQKPRQGGFTPRGETAKATRLSEEEHRKCMKEGRCFTCKMIGHLASKCPQKDAKAKKGTAEDDEKESKEGEDFPPA